MLSGQDNRITPHYFYFEDPISLSVSLFILREKETLPPPSLPNVSPLFTHQTTDRPTNQPTDRQRHGLILLITKSYLDHYYRHLYNVHSSDTKRVHLWMQKLVGSIVSYVRHLTSVVTILFEAYISIEYWCYIPYIWVSEDQQCRVFMYTIHKWLSGCSIRRKKSSLSIINLQLW